MVVPAKVAGPGPHARLKYANAGSQSREKRASGVTAKSTTRTNPSLSRGKAGPKTGRAGNMTPKSMARSNPSLARQR